MRELLFRAYLTRTIYVEEDGYTDAEKDIKFHLDNVAVYIDGTIGIRWDDFYKELKQQGFNDDEIEKAFDAYDDLWDERGIFTADAIVQYTGICDSFGNKIFEYDIVEYIRTQWSSYSEPVPHDLHTVGTIKYCDEDGSYRLVHEHGSMHLSSNDSRAKENIIKRLGSMCEKETSNGE